MSACPEVSALKLPSLTVFLYLTHPNSLGRVNKKYGFKVKEGSVKQRTVYGIAGLLAMSAFIVGLALSVTPGKTQAQSTEYCNPESTGSDWCTNWTVGYWLNDRTAGGTIGVADWDVRGATKKDGQTIQFNEKWALKKAMRIYSRPTNTAPYRVYEKKDLCRVEVAAFFYAPATSRYLDCATGGTIIADSVKNYSGADSTDTDYSGGQAARWWPVGLYGLIFWGNDGEPRYSQAMVYYPLEWEVYGSFR